MTNDTESTQAKYKLTLKGAGISIDSEVDGGVALEVMALVMGGPGTTAPRAPAKQGSKRWGARSKPKSRAVKAKASKPGVVSDLNLRPKGKQSFADLVAEKSPKSHEERLVVAVYWLRQIAGVKAVTLDHINTCYLDAGWARPSDLRNRVAVTTTRKKWFDASDGDDIKLTTLGEDEVRHKLPKKKKKT